MSNYAGRRTRSTNVPGTHDHPIARRNPLRVASGQKRLFAEVTGGKGSQGISSLRVAPTWKKPRLDRRDEARDLALDFVHKLMSARIQPIPRSDGMSFVRGIPDLETGTRDATIVVRKMTNAFWDACLKMVNTPKRRYRVAAIGTPGIGKTTTTPLLIRKLLKKDSTVVYLLRTEDKSGWYYEFTCKDGQYTAEVYPESLPWTEIKSLGDHSTYFIVDPSDTENSCSKSARFKPKMIIVASPDSRQWGGRNFCKGRRNVAGLLKFFPVWSLAELISAQPYIRRGLAKEKVIARYDMFGGCPGQVFADDASVIVHLRSQDEAFSELNASKVKKIAGGSISFKKDDPAGVLIGFDVPDLDDGDFGDCATIILSRSIEQRLFATYKTVLWDYLMMENPSKRSYTFERYVFYFVLNKYKKRFSVDTRKRRTKSKTRQKRMYHCKKLQCVDDPVAAVCRRNRESLVLFHPRVANCALFDCAYKDPHGQFHLIKATTSPSHPMSAKAITALDERVGPNVSVTLYYFVPSARLASFRTTNPEGEMDPIPSNWKVIFVGVPKPGDNEGTILRRCARSDSDAETDSDDEAR
jgi:hypothetical protein